MSSDSAPTDAGRHSLAREAAAAAGELAAAWAADPGAVAALLRHRAATAWVKEPAPDSCVLLERQKVSYATYAELQNADRRAVDRYVAAEQQYRDALHRLQTLE